MFAIAFKVYIAISVLLMLLWALRLAYQDIWMYYHPTSGGRYYYTKNGLWWLIIGLRAPGVNLLLVFISVYSWVREKFVPLDHL